MNTRSMDRDIKNSYRGKNEFKKYYRSITDLVNNAQGDQLAFSQTVLNWLHNFFCQLANEEL
jgi:hypothetical protein